MINSSVHQLPARSIEPSNAAENQLQQENMPLKSELPTLISIGSCHVGMAVGAAVNLGLSKAVSNNNMAHSTQEIIQLLNYYNNILNIPTDVMDLCLSSFACISETDLKSVDVATVEICNPYPIVYNKYVLNRNLVASKIVKYIQDMGDDQSFSAYHWFYTGLAKKNESVRIETSSKILEYIPIGDAESELYRDIIRHATVVELSPQQMRNDMNQVREILGCPLIGMTHTIRYFPDGRPVSWPSWFHKEVNRLFEEMDSPVVNPSDLVEKYGVEFSLKENLFHYSEEFVSTLGKLIAELAIKVLDR